MWLRSLPALLIALGIAGSIGPARAGYLSGEEYLYMEDMERTFYVMGLFDMLENLAENDPSNGAFYARVDRCTAGMTSSQLRNFIDDYVNSDETFEGYTMASNFSAALNTRCPP